MLAITGKIRCESGDDFNLIGPIDVRPGDNLQCTVKYSGSLKVSARMGVYADVEYTVNGRSQGKILTNNFAKDFPYKNATICVTAGDVLEFRLSTSESRAFKVSGNIVLFGN